MQLIENANKLHRMTSVLIAAGTVALGVADQLLVAVHGVVPPGVYAALSVAVIIARAVKQPNLDK